MLLLSDSHRGVSKLKLREFEHLMEDKNMILVFVKSYQCTNCMEDRWYLHKAIYNFLLRKDVVLINAFKA